MEEKRISIGLEPSFALPPKKVHFILGLGARGTLGLFSTDPIDSKGFCTEKMQGTCTNWESIGGIPLDAQTDVALEDDLGYGYKAYGLAGLELGPVAFIFRGGYQGLFFSEARGASYGGPMMEGALRVNFGGTSSSSPSSSRSPAEPDPPARASEPDPDPDPEADSGKRSSSRFRHLTRIADDAEDEGEDEFEEEEEPPPSRIRIGDVVTTAPDGPLLPVIHWELMPEATWNDFVRLFENYNLTDRRSQVATFLDAQNEPVKSMKEPILAYFDHIMRMNTELTYNLERILATAFTESRRQYLVDYHLRSRR